MLPRLPLFIACTAVVTAATFGLAAEEPRLRVESEVFVDDAEEPVSRSLTLFDGDTTWDFLAPPKDAAMSADAPAAFQEVVLYDPVRERVIVLDTRLKLKTQIDSLRLERLSASLGKWARSADDKLIRWAGDADIGGGIVEGDGDIELKGPRVRYAVQYAEAPSPEAARAYRGFADTAILLKALLHPGGLPPFPRLAINRRIEAAGGIPSEVTLEIGGPLPLVGMPAEKVRSIHKTMPQFTDADRRQIDEAAALMAVAEEVELADFVSRRAADRVARRGS